MASILRGSQFETAFAPTSIPVRQRKVGTRGKSGCRTCRIRRVKCDEATPSCKRCTSTGRKCDGYDTPSTRVPKDIGKGPHLATLEVRVLNAKIHPSLVEAGRDELDMFQFFRTKIAPRLAGDFDQDFWTRDLLQATRIHPAIWHASNALAAMYRWSSSEAEETGSLTRQNLYNFSLAQYNSSIRQLLDITTRPSQDTAQKETILMSIILFMGVCVLKGDQQEAFIHLRNGLQLFRQWRYWETAQSRIPGSALSTKSLVTLFLRLDSQALNLLDEASRLTWGKLPLPREINTTPFASVNEAYFEFELLLNGLFELLQRKEFMTGETSRDIFEILRSRFRQSFDLWGAKFSNLERSPFVKECDAESLIILQIRQASAHVGLYLDVSDHSRLELAMDCFLPQFQRIVDLAQILFDRKTMSVELARQRGSRPPAETMPLLTFGASVVESLFVVAVSCRESVLRRKAVSLLRLWPRSEGLWDTSIAASIAESIVNLEEHGAEEAKDGLDCSCILGFSVCSGHRVLQVDLKMLGEGKAKATLTTMNDMIGGTPGTTIHYG